MKKLIVFILSFGMCLGFIACNKGTTSDSLPGDSFTGESYSEAESFSADAESSDLAIESSSTETEEGWVTVTFRQNGCDDVVKTLKKGESLTDIPSTQAKKGYTVTWEEVNFTNITEDMVVLAIEKAKTYTVALDGNGGNLLQKTIVVTYGQEYELPTPTHEDKPFNCWTYEGKKVSSNGTWEIDVEGNLLTFVAQWGTKTWTNYH